MIQKHTNKPTGPLQNPNGNIYLKQTLSPLLGCMLLLCAIQFQDKVHHEAAPQQAKFNMALRNTYAVYLVSMLPMFFSSLIIFENFTSFVLNTVDQFSS